MAATLLGAPCGFLSFDEERVVRYVNAAGAALLGRPREALIGGALSAVLPLASRLFFDSHLLPLLALHGRADEIYVSLLGADGAPVPVLLSAARAADEGGPRTDLAFLAMRRRNLLERELVGAAEAALRDKDEALLVAERARAGLARHERLASLGTLAAGVAHEINNPLAYVAGNLELLDEALARPGLEGEGLGPLVREAREGAERIRGIVNTLRTLSRVDEARVAPVDLRRAVDAALRIAGVELHHRARVELEVGPVPFVEGDDGHLVQVIINLLVNAAQALPAGAAERNLVRVALRTDAEGWAVLEVRDNGPGVPPELLDRIFDPFFTTKPPGQGTGLGLSLCHGIIAGLGGKLSVESAPGEGACFRVTLPPSSSAPPSAPPSAPASAPRPPPPEAAPVRARLRVIDDDPLIAAVIVRALGDYDVRVEVSGRAAVARVEAGEAFDLMLCDVMMPDVTGIEVHAAVCRADPALGARTIFMTGGAFTESVRAFLERVPNRRLAKPFGLRDLRRACASVLAGAGGAAPPK